MSITAFISLQDCQKLPISEIGRTGKTLSLLAQNSVPLIATRVIPHSALVEIATHNQLSLFWSTLQSELQLSDIHHQQVALKKIRSFITSLKIPVAYTTAWHKMYSTIFNQGFVCVKPSFIQENDETVSLTQSNIRGEANLIESILATWAEHISLAHLNAKNDLIPFALVVQAQPQPLISGKVWTSHPSLQSKTQIKIAATWGVLDSVSECDHYIMDIRTENILSAELQPTTSYLVRKNDGLVKKALPTTTRNQRVLSAEALRYLTSLTAHIKRLFIKHIQLDWEVVESTLVITDCKMVGNNTSQPSFSQQLPLVKGIAISGGIIESEVVFIPATRFVTHIPAGKIVVVKKLTRHHLALIAQAGGIICEEYIEHPPLLDEIRRMRIPVLIEAKLATKLIKNDQRVILDTTSGCVYPTVLKSNSAPTPTITKVGAMIGTLSTSTQLDYSQIDQIVLRTEFFWLSGGYHPSFLAKSKHLSNQFCSQLEQFLQKAVPEKQQLWLKLSSFSSQDLRHLQHSPTDDVEINPSFGRRGAFAALDNPHPWILELKSVAHFLQNRAGTATIIIPFVRSSSELGLVLHLLQKDLPASITARIKWMPEIVSPGGMYALPEIVRHTINGVVLSLPLLHTTAMGIDPENEDMVKHYPQDTALLASYIKQASQATQLHQTKKLPLFVEITQIQDEIMKTIVQHTLPGVLIRPNLASVAKKRIMELEKELIHG